MLSSVYISNYKCLHDMTVPLDKLTMFGSAAGTGKSTLIEAILTVSHSVELGVVPPWCTLHIEFNFNDSTKYVISIDSGRVIKESLSGIFDRPNVFNTSTVFEVVSQNVKPNELLLSRLFNHQFNNNVLTDVHDFFMLTARNSRGYEVNIDTLEQAAKLVGFSGIQLDERITHGKLEFSNSNVYMNTSIVGFKDADRVIVNLSPRLINSIKFYLTYFVDGLYMFDDATAYHSLDTLKNILEHAKAQILCTYMTV